MKRNSDAAARAPRGRLGNVLLNLLITLIAGAVYFYVAIPAINLQSGEFYSFVFMLCMIYLLCALVTSGFRGKKGEKPFQRGQLKEYLPLSSSSACRWASCSWPWSWWPWWARSSPCPSSGRRPTGICSPWRTGSSPRISARSPSMRSPLWTEDSADYLGDRQMGTLSDMVSQFEYSNDSTQINYQGRPVRVAPIAYADLIKWFTNRGRGPARLCGGGHGHPGGHRWSASPRAGDEVLLLRAPQPQHRAATCASSTPPIMFATPQFEIDEEGNPWWIAPRVVKTIGLFGGTDIDGAVLCNAVTGESTYYARRGPHLGGQGVHCPSSSCSSTTTTAPWSTASSTPSSASGT